MDPAGTFYQSLSGVSFTLLGIWFGVMQFGHGSWRGQDRHRSTLHIALHFFLPGLASMVALLAANPSGALIWRGAFLVVGVVGFVEAVSFMRASGGPVSRAGRTLRVLDLPVYLAIVAGVFVPPGVMSLTPLQIEGIAVGALFTIGLCLVWLAFAERPDEPEQPTGSGALSEQEA